MANVLCPSAVIFLEKESDMRIPHIGNTMSVERCSSNSGSPLFESPISQGDSRWLTSDSSVFLYQDGSSSSEENVDSASECESDAGGDIAEWMANSCITDESDEGNKTPIAPMDSPLRNVVSEIMSVRTKGEKPSPWLGALKNGATRGCSNVSSSASGSSSFTSQEGSQEGSPTSVLGQAGSQAWDLLFAAAGQVQKLARGQQLTAGSSVHKINESKESGDQGTRENAMWMHSGAASLGLTAGAAAPVAMPVPLAKRQLFSSPGPATVGELQTPCTAVRPAAALSPTSAAISTQAGSTPAAQGARLPSRAYPGLDCRSHSAPRPLHPMDSSPDHRLPHRQPASLPPFGNFRNQMPQRGSPMMVPRGEPGLRRPQFPNQGLRGMGVEEPLHAVVLGHGKESNAGTGVFLPRGAASSQEVSGSQSADGNGPAASHSTTVLLPARLIQSLGLNINSENSVVVNRSPGMSPPPPRHPAIAAQQMPRRPMGPPQWQRPQMGHPQEEFGTGGSFQFAPRNNNCGGRQYPSQPQHRWGPPPANRMLPPGRGPQAGPKSPTYANLPSEWAY